VWAGYRFVTLADSQEPDGLKVIDLGAGHASGAETLCGRVIAALKSEALLNESVGAGYIDRNWPPALRESGAWPLASLRQSFLNGALTRLIDPDAVLRKKIVEFVEHGSFGLASGARSDGTYDRLWFEERIMPDEVTFESDVFLLTKAKAQSLRKAETGRPSREEETEAGKEKILAETGRPGAAPETEVGVTEETRVIRLVGTVPPEIWNRLGTKILPKLRSGSELQVGVNFSVTVRRDLAQGLESELRQILADLGLAERVHIE